MVSDDPLVVGSPGPLEKQRPSLLLLDHTYPLDKQISAEIPKFSGFSG